MGAVGFRRRAAALLEGLGEQDLRSAVALLEAVTRFAGSTVGPFGEVVGLERVHQEAGRCAFRLAGGAHLLNPYGVLHGGVLFAAMDTSMGGAVASLLDPSERCATIEAKVNYVAGATGGPVRAEAEVVHRGGRLLVLAARATAEDGGLLALMSGSFLVTR